MDEPGSLSGMKSSPIPDLGPEDSMFYGMIFENSTYSYVAKMFPKEGYAGFLHGHVVDMLYFPIIHSTYPDWIPFIGGKEFEFFSPIFNIADASISVGVIVLLLFQKRFFRKEDETEAHTASSAKQDVSRNYELGNIEQGARKME